MQNKRDALICCNRCVPVGSQLIRCKNANLNPHDCFMKQMKGMERCLLSYLFAIPVKVHHGARSLSVDTQAKPDRPHRLSGLGTSWTGYARGRDDCIASQSPACAKAHLLSTGCRYGPKRVILKYPVLNAQYGLLDGYGVAYHATKKDCRGTRSTRDARGNHSPGA